jgi:hypothetical protein
VTYTTPPSAASRGPLFERWFDDHSDGKFVKTLLISMLLIATVVQPFSLIYTAYGEHLPDHWWAWTPALAMLLFVALDWTILPLAYFFATTHKISLKIVLALMLGIVLFGAFEGYFTATERLIAMRLQDITKHRLALEQHQDEVAGLTAALDEAKRQGQKDRDVLAKQREELTTQVAQIDAQIATAQKTLGGADAQHLKLMAEIKDGCLKVAYVCLKPQQEAERARYEAANTVLQKQIATLQTSKLPINEQLAVLRDKGDEKVVAANADLKAGNTQLSDVRKGFEAAVLDSQVYRWAGALMGVSPRQVTAEQANRVLDIFPPGGPVPPPEEIVTKNPRVANGQQ